MSGPQATAEPNACRVRAAQREHIRSPKVSLVIKNNGTSSASQSANARANRLPRLVGARHEDRVDRLDDAVVALDVRRPVV